MRMVGNAYKSTSWMWFERQSSQKARSSFFPPHNSITNIGSKGFDGRFGAGLPRISDGSFLFLQHMIAKMKRDNGGSRIADCDRV